jgi:hypothetical protein
MGENKTGKSMIEDMVLEQLLDSFPIITGRTPTDEWHDHVEKVEGSPDHIIGRDGKAFGIELTEIRDADDAWGYVDEAYRLASKKSDSYTRRGIFRFPIALVMYSTTPPLFDIRKSLEGAISQADFETLGFSEVWAVDFSDAYTCFASNLSIGLGFTASATMIGSHTHEPACPPRWLARPCPQRRHWLARLLSLLWILHRADQECAHAAPICGLWLANSPVTSEGQQWAKQNT